MNCRQIEARDFEPGLAPVLRMETLPNPDNYSEGTLVQSGNILYTKRNNTWDWVPTSDLNSLDLAPSVLGFKGAASESINLSTGINHLGTGKVPSYIEVVCKIKRSFDDISPSGMILSLQGSVNYFRIVADEDKSLKLSYSLIGSSATTVSLNTQYEYEEWMHLLLEIKERDQGFCFYKNGVKTYENALFTHERFFNSEINTFTGPYASFGLFGTPHAQFRVFYNSISFHYNHILNNIDYIEPQGAPQKLVLNLSNITSDLNLLELGDIILVGDSTYTYYQPSFVSAKALNQITLSLPVAGDMPMVAEIGVPFIKVGNIAKGMNITPQKITSNEYPTVYFLSGDAFYYTFLKYPNFKERHSYYQSFGLLSYIHGERTNSKVYSSDYWVGTHNVIKLSTSAISNKLTYIGDYFAVPIINKRDLELYEGYGLAVDNVSTGPITINNDGSRFLKRLYISRGKKGVHSFTGNLLVGTTNGGSQLASIPGGTIKNYVVNCSTNQPIYLTFDTITTPDTETIITCVYDNTF